MSQRSRPSLGRVLVWLVVIAVLVGVAFALTCGPRMLHDVSEHQSSACGTGGCQAGSSIREGLANSYPPPTHGLR